MDHSIRGYLERRSTEELHFAFRFCLQHNDFLFYEHIAVMCLEILECRLSTDDNSLLEYRIALEEHRKALMVEKDF